MPSARRISSGVSRRGRMPESAEAQHMQSRWDIVAATKAALARGGASLRNVPGLVKRLIREGSWREYVTPVGRVESFPDFGSFIVHPWGLDTTVELLQKICGEDMETLDLLDKETTRQRGRPKKAQHNETIDTQEEQELLLPEPEPAKANHHDV